MSSTPVPNSSPNATANIITAIGHAFKTQTGDPVSSERIAQLLTQHMNQLSELAKQGKLNQQQIMQVRSPLCSLFLYMMLGYLLMS